MEEDESQNIIPRGTDADPLNELILDIIETRRLFEEAKHG